LNLLHWNICTAEAHGSATARGGKWNKRAHRKVALFQHGDHGLTNEPSCAENGDYVTLWVRCVAHAAQYTTEDLRFGRKSSVVFLE
jgi:hypothetical protein